MTLDWTQDRCNPDNPEEYLLWAILGFEWNDQPFPMAVPIAKAMSAHLKKCGVEHHPELQQIKYQRPYRGQQTMFNGSGRWVPVETPDLPAVVMPDVSQLTLEEQEVLLAQFRALGKIPQEGEDGAAQS